MPTLVGAPSQHREVLLRRLPYFYLLSFFILDMKYAEKISCSKKKREKISAWQNRKSVHPLCGHLGPPTFSQVPGSGPKTRPTDHSTSGTYYASLKASWYGGHELRWFLAFCCQARIWARAVRATAQGPEFEGPPKY